jgi:hypothetical protein
VALTRSKGKNGDAYTGHEETQWELEQFVGVVEARDRAGLKERAQQLDDEDTDFADRRADEDRPDHATDLAHARVTPVDSWPVVNLLAPQPRKEHEQSGYPTRHRADGKGRDAEAARERDCDHKHNDGTGRGREGREREPAERVEHAHHESGQTFEHKTDHEYPKEKHPFLDRCGRKPRPDQWDEPPCKHNEHHRERHQDQSDDVADVDRESPGVGLATGGQSKAEERHKRGGECTRDHQGQQVRHLVCQEESVGVGFGAKEVRHDNVAHQAEGSANQGRGDYHQRRLAHD